MEKEIIITAENVEAKSSELVNMAIEICRSQKFLRLKQKSYDALDYALYQYYKENKKSYGSFPETQSIGSSSENE